MPHQLAASLVAIDGYTHLVDSQSKLNMTKTIQDGRASIPGWLFGQCVVRVDPDWTVLVVLRHSVSWTVLYFNNGNVGS